MAPASSQGAAGVFDASSGRLLIRVACRMLGPVAGAEPSYVCFGNCSQRPAAADDVR